jgi:hypothetical protein
MMALLNSCTGLVSGTAAWQVAGSASMFGWLLLLPPAEFPGTQEPATVAVQVETKPPVEIASPCQSPDGCPDAGSAPVCSPEHAAKLQELMALRARVGTSLGSAEDFQVALASLFEQDGHPTPNSEPQSLPFESGQRPQNATNSTADPAVPNVQQALPRNPMVAAPPWVQAHNQVQPQYAQHPAHPEQFHSQPPSFTLPLQAPMDGAPVMVSPHVVPNHFTGPNNVPMPVGPVQQFGPPQVGLQHAGPGQWQPRVHEQPPIQSTSQDQLQSMPVVIPPSPHFSPARSPNSGNHEGPIRISRNDHRPEHENREGVRQQVEPELRHRIQHAARMLEESAWELEQAGEYSLADDVRRQAMELYRRARGNQNR